jgi:hypothetical protein
MTTAEFEQLDETEAEAIICWRFHELMESGFELEAALKLAVATQVDLDRASNLLRRGCAPKTALRILL